MHFLIAIVINAWKLLVLPLLLLRRRRTAPSGTWLTLRVDGPVVPVARESHFWERGSKPVSLHAVRRVAALAKDDPRIRGLFVNLKQMTGGSASAMALRSALEAWKQAGKQVVVYLPRGAGTRAMLIASIADRIVAAPGTEVAPLGFAFEAPYVKEALERIGLEPEVLAQGRYKTAGEFLIADGMSEAQREQLERLLDVSWENLLETLAQGRNVTRERARAWIDEGPWVASEAREQGLIDDVRYGDELIRTLGTKEGQEPPMMPMEVYQRRRRLGFRPLRRPSRIAVVEVHGPIASDQPPGWFPLAVESQVCACLEQAREQRWVKGVVVHIDSRGGSAAASERMWHEVRRLAEEKPVVACLSDAAASGGYMVAVAAHAIVAQPTTVTGSIGVVSARMVTGKLMERLGIRTETIKRGARADLLSPNRRLDNNERTSLDRVMSVIYRDFVRVVAQGRGRSEEEVEPLASGRVWSGLDAFERGLVDRLGGMEEALCEVRRRIGAGGAAMEPVLISQRKVPSLPEMLKRVSVVVPSGLGAELMGLGMAGEERIWMWCGWGEREG